MHVRMGYCRVSNSLQESVPGKVVSSSRPVQKRETVERKALQETKAHGVEAWRRWGKRSSYTTDVVLNFSINL